jgi:hypothetical protein
MYLHNFSCEKSSPKFALLLKFPKITQSLQSPKKLKFSQSDHTGGRSQGSCDGSSVFPRGKNLLFNLANALKSGVSSVLKAGRPYFDVRGFEDFSVCRGGSDFGPTFSFV